MISNKLKIILILISMMLVSLLASAQPESADNLPPGRIKRYAKNSMRVGDYYSAIYYLEKYLAVMPGNFKMTYKLADMYRFTRDYKNAIIMYQRAFTGDGKKYAKALYFEGMMQKCVNDYPKARDNFKLYMSEDKTADDYKIYKKLAQNEIDGIDKAEGLLKNPVRADIKHLDTTINHPNVDYAPVPVNDSVIIFSSLRVSKEQYFEVNDSTKFPVRKIYTSRKYKGRWIKATEFSRQINSDDEDTGNGSFSPDGKRFYFTRTKKNWKNIPISTLWVSEKAAGIWKKPELLNEDINMPNYSSTEPTVGKESKTNYDILYFVSDRPGGKGGKDLYYIIYNNDKKVYKKVKNCTSKINTAGDEITPFFDNKNHALYFSSNGWPGLGGMDIFRTVGETNAWLPPENVGYPINSTYEDIYYIFGKDKAEGYLVSNRPGGISLRHETCCYDIYSYKISDYLHLAVKGPVLEDVVRKNDTTKSDTVKLASWALVSLYQYDANSEETILIKTDTVLKGANYFFDLEQDHKYKVVVNAEKFLSTQKTVSTFNMFKSDTLKQPLVVKKMGLGPIVVKNIYYDFDSPELTANSLITIDTTILEMLNANPDIIVELSSHTDGKGSDVYNNKLSQKRAESVVNYLIAKGIDPKRLVPKGYGKTVPLAPNTKPDGTDYPEGRAKNRRTEFRIIGTLTIKRTKIIYHE